MGNRFCSRATEEGDDEQEESTQHVRPTIQFDTTGTELRWCGGNLDGFLEVPETRAVRLEFVESISLWNCRSTDPRQTTAQLAWLIRSCPNLLSFTIHESFGIFLIHTPGQVHTLVEALYTATSLKYLTLSCSVTVDTELGKSLGALTHNRLVRLSLEHFDFADPASLRQWTVLGLSTATRLQSLHLAHCRITDVGFRSLVSALLSATALKTLHMSHDNLTWRSLVALGKLLEQHPRLAFLHLEEARTLFAPVNECNELESDELEAGTLAPFLRGLRSNTTLRELTMRETGINLTTMTEIARALVLNKTLQSLDVSRNPCWLDGWVDEGSLITEPERACGCDLREALRQNTALLHLQPPGQQAVLNRNRLFRSILHLEQTASSTGVWSHWLHHLQNHVGPSAVFGVLLHKAPMLSEQQDQRQEEQQP